MTGASGNIGSAVLREVSAKGDCELLALARRRPPVPHAADQASVEWRSADVSYDDLVPLFTGAGAVVHLAWKMQPTHRPEETWETNVVGTRRVLQAVRDAGVPAVVCASSVAAYSPVFHDDPVEESWQTDGASAANYCREKAYVERLLDGFEVANPDTRVVRVRPAFVFQRSSASEQRRIFGGPMARPGILRRGLLPVLPVPTGLRMQAVHAGDVGRAVEAMVRLPVRGAFNLAGNGVVRRAELGELLGARTVQVPSQVPRSALAAAWTVRAAGVPGTMLDALMRVPLLATERARAELGWAPHHSGMEALGAVVDGLPQRWGSGLPPLRP